MFLPLDSNSSVSTTHSRFGSMRVMSAGEQGEVDGTAMHQPHKGAQGCFQHRDAELGIVVGAHLGSEFVRGVVSRDAVYGAVHEAFQQSFCVVRLPKGRVDLGVGVVVIDGWD